MDYAEEKRRIAAAESLAPQVVRIINASRVTELQLIIAEAMGLIRMGKYQEALSKLDSARPDFSGHSHPIPSQRDAPDDAPIAARDSNL